MAWSWAADGQPWVGALTPKRLPWTKLVSALMGQPPM